jgi:hypothetical protein
VTYELTRPGGRETPRALPGPAPRPDRGPFGPVRAVHQARRCVIQPVFTITTPAGPLPVWLRVALSGPVDDLIIPCGTMAAGIAACGWPWQHPATLWPRWDAWSLAGLAGAWLAGIRRVFRFAVAAAIAAVGRPPQPPAKTRRSA